MVAGDLECTSVGFISGGKLHLRRDCETGVVRAEVEFDIGGFTGAVEEFGLDFVNGQTFPYKCLEELTFIGAEFPAETSAAVMFALPEFIFSVLPETLHVPTQAV